MLGKVAEFEMWSGESETSYKSKGIKWRACQLWMWKFIRDTGHGVFICGHCNDCLELLLIESHITFETELPVSISSWNARSVGH